MTRHDEPLTMSQEAYRATVGGVLNLCSATALEILTREEILNVEPWQVFGVGTLAAAGAAGAVHVLMGQDPRCDSRMRRTLTWFAGGMGVANAALLSHVQAAGGLLGPDGWGGLPGAPLELVGGTGVIALATWAVATFVRRHLGIQQVEEVAARDAEQARTTTERVLELAGYGHLTSDNGSRFDAGTTYLTRNPTSGKYIEDDRDAPRAVANALNTITGTTYSAGRVLIEQGGAAGLAAIRVLERDVLAETINAPLPTGPASIRDTLRIGRFITGDPVDICLYSTHAAFTGRTRSGKSSLINQVIAFLSRCRDAVIWVAGKEKVTDLTDLWMTEFLATGRCVFDWVASDQAGTLKVLATAYQAARRRYAKPKADRPRGYPCAAWPAIVVVLDEASFTLNDSEEVLCADGKRRNASELVAAILRIGLGVEVYVVLATQRGVQGEFGSEGGVIKNNVGLSIVFQCKDAAEIDYALDANKWVNAAVISGKERRGAFYIKDDEGFGQAAKGLYFSDDAVPRVAAVNAGLGGKLDEWTAAGLTVCNNAYAARWGDSPQEFWDYLHGLGDEAPPPPVKQKVNAGNAGDDIEAAMQATYDETLAATAKAYPEPEDKDEATAILDALDMDAELARLVGDGTTETAAKTWREKIEAALITAGMAGMTNNEIAAHLGTTPNLVRKHTAVMVTEGSAVRAVDGKIRKA